ncbi:MAG: glycosyltransferase [Lachnospiraceae bacterium]|nr:glycosyltransferase [Lachnospiraceae bacterium]
MNKKNIDKEGIFIRRDKSESKVCNNKEIKVSVICITYNQEKYLKKALDSMLSQITNFSYEIIIHDDLSTDNTRDILREYENKYSGVIHVIYEKENMYSQGIDFVASMIKESAMGKYIALCEGDDFWIDEHKLQLQFDALENHPQCDMCACRGCTTTEDGLYEVSEIRPAEFDSILSVENVICGGGQYLVTAGLFFKKSMYDEMLPFEKIIPLDYAQQIKGALRGGIYYIDRKMAVYRRYAGGSWTNDVLKNKEKLKIQWEKEKALLCQLNIDTKGRYSSAIAERMKAYIPFENQLEEHNEEISKVLFGLCENIYIWGRGRRGASLEDYCKKKHIKVTGICDVINTDIGGVSNAGNLICHTDEVKEKAYVILASNRYAYMDLCKEGIEAKVLDFEQYMPWG